MSNFVDVKLTDQGDFFDISFNEEGDFERVDDLETAFIMSLFANKRATAAEVPNSYLRGGWWGNLFLDTAMGSTMWLLNQAVSNDTTLATAISYMEDALKWMLDLQFADTITVTGSNDRGDIDLTATVSKNGSKITEKVYNLWQNTVKDV